MNGLSGLQSSIRIDAMNDAFNRIQMEQLINNDIRDNCLATLEGIDNSFAMEDDEFKVDPSSNDSIMVQKAKFDKSHGSNTLDRYKSGSSDSGTNSSINSSSSTSTSVSSSSDKIEPKGEGFMFDDDDISMEGLEDIGFLDECNSNAGGSGLDDVDEDDASNLSANVDDGEDDIEEQLSNLGTLESTDADSDDNKDDKDIDDIPDADEDEVTEFWERTDDPNFFVSESAIDAEYTKMKRWL